MCLTTGIPWETYWTLTGSELSALSTAHERVQRRKKGRG